MREIKLERRPADCERGIVEKQISRGGEKRVLKKARSAVLDGRKERRSERRENGKGELLGHVEARFGKE